MYRMYLDESDDLTKWFGVGGFVGKNEAWNSLQDKWLTTLPKSVDYFHATDCFGGRKQFRGMGEAERILLLDRLTDLILETEVYLICWAIDVPFYHRFAPKLRQNHFLTNKYVAGFEACIQSACRDYMQPGNTWEYVNTGDTCAIFFEDNDCRHTALEASTRLRNDTNLDWRDRIGTATYGSKYGAAAVPLLQVADLGAFLGTKHAGKAPNAKIAWQPYYKKLVDGRRIARVARIDTYSLKALHEIHEMLQKDPHAIDKMWADL